jgi:hypothetical protein
MYPLEAIRYWWQRYLSFFIFLIVFDILLDFCAVTNQGGWTKEVRTNWSRKKWCWYRPGTDHAISRLRGTTEVRTSIRPGRAETRYYSYLKDCLLASPFCFWKDLVRVRWTWLSRDKQKMLLPIWCRSGDDLVGASCCTRTQHCQFLPCFRQGLLVNSYRTTANLQSTVRLMNFGQTD